LTGRGVDDYKLAVQRYVQKGDTQQEKDNRKHIDKLNVFIRAACDSRHKHFKRWLNCKLLPAALMSEAPTAKVVAAAMLRRRMPTAQEFADYSNVVDDSRLSGFLNVKSTVHK